MATIWTAPGSAIGVSSTGVLHDAEGVDLGRFHFVGTVLDITEDGDLVSGIGTVAFATDDIFTRITTELPNAATASASVPQEVDMAIVGGTGAFASASGLVTIAPPGNHALDLNDWAVNIEVDCRA